MNQKLLKGSKIIILDLETDQIGVSLDSVGDTVAFQLNDVQWSDLRSQHQLIKDTNCMF